MPELPEVESTRRLIAPTLVGGKIENIFQGKPLRWPLDIEPSALHGRVVQSVRRRGKYLLVDLDQGLLLIHLGMSGSLQFVAPENSSGPHDHFEIQTTQGTMRLTDPRRFGAVVCAAEESKGRAAK